MMDNESNIIGQKSNSLCGALTPITVAVKTFVSHWFRVLQVLLADTVCSELLYTS